MKLINQNQISNGKTQFNQKFLTKTIGDIYSDDLSRRHTIIPLNHNKNLIYKLMNDKDENKKKYFQKLFRLTFIQCLKHFIGEEPIELLEGLKCFKDMKDEIINFYKEDGDGDRYYKVLEYALNNFQFIVNNKKTKKKRKKLYY